MPHFASPHLAMPGLGQGSGPGIIMIFFVFITFLLPATCPLVPRSGRRVASSSEAGGDESDETQSACSGMIIANLPLENCIIALLAF